MAPTRRFVMEDFATRVQARRRELEWSQTELAKRTDLNLGNINEVEHAKKRSVRAETIVALAVAMGVSTDYLLGLTDDPTPQSERAPAKARLTPGLWKGQVWMAPDFDDTDEELIRLFEGEDNDVAS